MRTIYILLILLVVSLQAAAPTSGSKACPSSGNTAILATAARAVTYSIQAPTGNTGVIAFGGSNVTTSTGPSLAAGQSYTAIPQGNANAYDLSQVFIACTQAADAIRYFYQ